MLVKCERTLVYVTTNIAHSGNSVTFRVIVLVPTTTRPCDCLNMYIFEKILPFLLVEGRI